MKKLARIISGLLVVSLAVPAAGQVTDDDIDRAREEVNRITSESARLGQEVIDAYGRQEALNSEIEDLKQSIEFAQTKMSETEERLEDLAVELYMGSTSGLSLSVLFSATDQEYPAGMEYLREANGVDESAIDEIRSFRDELDHQTGRLSEALAEQEALASELEALAGDLQEDLAAAQQVYDDLVAQQQREEEERRRRAEEERRRQLEEEQRQAEEEANSPSESVSDSEDDTGSGEPEPSPDPAPTPSASGGYCPVAGAVSFTDSWGAPRSGGRSHKGVDMIAARGVPIVAVYSGTVYRLSDSSLGGKSVYFYSDAGDLYYYAHLDGFGDISPGQDVAGGYVLGYNGSSGNAPEYLPHLHWEFHPGGGGAVNPYPLARELCG